MRSEIVTGGGEQMPLAAVSFDLSAGPVLLVGALGAAALGGAVLTRRYLPVSEVIVFLAIGLALGPQAFGAIDEDRLQAIRPVASVALAAMVFLLGDRLRLAVLRSVRRTVIPMAVLGSLASFVAVFAAVVAAGGRSTVAFLLAALSPATAPVTVRALVAEQRAAGRFTDDLLAATAVNNVCAALLFGIGAPLVLAGISDESATATAAMALLQILGASLACGYVGGRLLAGLAARIEARDHQFLLVWVLLILAVGAARYFGASVVIVALVMGAVAANDRRTPHAVFEHVQLLEPPIFLVFFLVTGADAHLDRFAELGLLGAAFIAFRVVGRLAGGRLGLLVTREGREVRHGVWSAAAQLPLAGMAVGLASFVVSSTESVGSAEVGQQVAAIVLGAVFVFELITPLVVHRALVVAGEQGAVG